MKFILAIKNLFKKNKTQDTQNLTLSEEIEQLEQDIEKTKNMLSGIGWFVVAGLCSATLSTITKILVTRYHVFQITFLHAFLAFPLYIPLMIKTNFQVLQTKQLSLHFLRGIANVLCAFSWFYALKFTPISEAVSIKFITPIIITLMAVIFLKEKLRANTIIPLITGFLGILIIIRPEFNEFKIGYLMVLLSAFLSSIYHLIVKKLSNKDSSDTVTLYFIITMSLLTLPFALGVFKMMAPKDFLLIILLAIVTTGYIKFMSLAYSKTDISILQPFDFMRLVFASILAFFIFKDTISPWTVIGSIIILTSSSFIAINKKYEQKLTKSKKMIKKLMEAKSNFFANVNHELRTPLNAILGFSKMIKDKNKDRKEVSETYQFTKQIESAGEHLLGMVNNILDATKLEKKKMILAEENCNLVHDILNPSIKMLEIKAKEKNLSISFANKKVKNYLVFVDKIKLKQVIINLLSNAVKFTKKNGKITIKIQQKKVKNMMFLSA